jgi:hypothetical protein
MRKSSLVATALGIFALTGCTTSPQYSGSVTPVRHPVWFNDPLPVGDYTYRSTMDATGGTNLDEWTASRAIASARRKAAPRRL